MNGSQPPLRGAQPLVDLQKLIGDVFDNVLAEFVQLTLTAPEQSESDRKRALLSHLHGARQGLLRCLALLQWKPWKVAAELTDHERVLDVAAGHVRLLAEVVGALRQQAAGRVMAGAYANMADVNTALEVLTTGTYQELPSIILHRPPAFQPPPASLARQRSRLAHVTQLIRSRLVQAPLPPGLKVVSVANGAAVLRAEGLYEAKLTLVPSEPLPGLEPPPGAAAAADGGGAGAGPSAPPAAAEDDWAAAASAAAAGDPVAAAAAAQRWKWRLIHFVLLVGVPFYDARQPGQIMHTCNFHMVLAADNAAYLRRQRAAAGGAAAAAGAQPAASSALSDAAAPSGVGGAAAGGAATSLAAALKRSEDDEACAPLAVMHAILADVAGRLLADELAAAARALAAPGSRWHGHIAVRPPQKLRPGVRVEYWVGAPPLLHQRALPAAGPGEDHAAVRPGPPYLELGMGEGGCVEVLHAPSSLHKPVSVSKLRLDTRRCNLEEVLLRAANMSAQYQLLQVRRELKGLLVEAMGARAPTLRLTNLARQLWCRDAAALAPQQQPGLAGAEEGEEPPAGAAATAAGAAGPMDVDGGAGDASTAPIPPPTAPPPEVTGLLAAAAGPGEGEGCGIGGLEGAVVALNAPVLEYLVAGTTELKVGKHLFSGRLTLRPGQDERDEGSLDHAAVVAASEEKVNAAALAAYTKASSEPYPAQRALTEACRALARVLARAHTSTDATHFIQAARRAGLHISRLPPGLLETFAAANPGLTIEARGRGEVATWALQSLPFPPSFPPLEPAGGDTPPHRLPACLAFFLQSRLSLTSQHVLVAVACSRQLTPLKVLSCIPVPPSAYKLPEHVMAAYMAASTAGAAEAAAQPAAAAGTAAGAAAGGGGGGLGSHATHGSAGTLTLTGASGHHSGSGSPPLCAHASVGHDLHGHGFPAPHEPGSPGLAGEAGGLGHMVGGLLAPSHPGRASGGGGAAGSPPLAGATPHSQPGSRPPHFPHPPHSQQPAPAGGESTTAAPAAHRPARPTGQQVAVMLAQQQLASVVRWCRRRMVWEALLVQLGAVGAAFVELGRPPASRVRLTRVAGTVLPCRIARRGGLAPAAVGPSCLELELGPDALAGQVTARLYGTFLCAPSCAPLPGSSASGFVLEGPVPTNTSAAALYGARPHDGRTVVCLRRQYCLERGDSALTLVQEVAAIIRMQTLLARLEMLVRPYGVSGGRRVPQQLAVLHADGNGAAANGSGTGAGRTARPLQAHNHVPSGKLPAADSLPAAAAEVQYNGLAAAGEGWPPAAKRIKLEPGAEGGTPGPEGHASQLPHAAPYGAHGPTANGLANGGHATGVEAGGGGRGGGGGGAPPGQGHGPAQGGPGSGALTWHWPLVGTLTLEQYGISAATIRVSPASAPAPTAPPDAASPTALPPPPLLLHLAWAPRDVRHLAGGGPAAAAATPGAAASPGPSPTPGTTPHPRPASPPPLAASSPALSQPPPSPLLAPGAAGTTSRTVVPRPGEAFGGCYADLVLATAACVSAHGLPPEFLHVIEEYCEGGEEGKALDALALAAWPLAGLCGAARPGVLAAHGLAAEGDVRPTLYQPPYCHRLVARRRAHGPPQHVFIDLLCQALGRSYLRVSVPAPPPGAAAAAAQQQQQQQSSPQDGGGAGSPPERLSASGVKPEPGGGADGGGPGGAVLSALRAAAAARLGPDVHVSAGGRGAVYGGLGMRPSAALGPWAPLWLLVPNDRVQAAVELVYDIALTT